MPAHVNPYLICTLFRQVAQSLKQSPRSVHAHAVLAALAWLHSLSHVLLLPNPVSTAVWGRGTLQSQLAGNCLENNGNQVSRRSVCLDVSWLFLVFPADSSDSVLALVFCSLWKIILCWCLDMGRTELAVTFGDLAGSLCLPSASGIQMERH